VGAARPPPDHELDGSGLAGLPEATPGCEPAQGGHFVVVEGATAASEPRPGAERRASGRRLRAAGRLAALERLAVPGGLLVAMLPLGAGGLLAADAPLAALAWGGVTALVAAGCLLLPRQPRHAVWLPTLLLLACASIGAAAWGAAPAWQPALAAAALAWAVVAAVAVAPWRPAALPLALVPLAVAAVAVPSSQALAWALAALVGSAAVVAGVGLRHHVWQRGERRLTAAEARIEQLQAERDQALRTDAEKSRFVAIASHDLRQPVHALGLFAATLQRRLQHTPDEALVRNFLHAVDDLERSFSAMLDISRLDGGALSPRLATFPLRDMFRRLQMQYGGQAELCGLGLRFSTGRKSVTSDPQLLERIVGNLVQNAIKYTQQGGVVVVARSTSTHTNIEVWDTGLGIPAPQLPRIFEEFYQVAPGKRDRSHGMGMGLAIVKRLARLLGLRLEVSSRPGRGTMFRVGVPIGALAGLQDDMAPADTLPMQVLTPQMVLVVDDDEPIREGLRVLLQAWGYQTITAANAAEAEQAVVALEGRIDLVLTDLQLAQDPNEPDGLAVVERVRRLCGYPVPAVLVTGDTSPPAVQALAAGGDPVLFKPVQPRRLFDAMRAALG
jgi:signal transduction histidine kinase/ActR/RegA family two-component response regulator